MFRCTEKQNVQLGAVLSFEARGNHWTRTFLNETCTASICSVATTKFIPVSQCLHLHKALCRLLSHISYLSHFSVKTQTCYNVQTLTHHMPQKCHQPVLPHSDMLLSFTTQSKHQSCLVYPQDCRNWIRS